LGFSNVTGRTDNLKSKIENPTCDHNGASGAESEQMPAGRPGNRAILCEDRPRGGCYSWRADPRTAGFVLWRTEN
jgi:hypothetical protein